MQMCSKTEPFSYCIYIQISVGKHVETRGGGDHDDDDDDQQQQQQQQQQQSKKKIDMKFNDDSRLPASIN